MCMVAKKCHRIGVFRGLVWAVENDDANTLWHYFNVIIAMPQPGTLLNPPISRPRSHFNVSYIDMSEYSISCLLYTSDAADE